MILQMWIDPEVLQKYDLLFTIGKDQWIYLLNLFPSLLLFHYLEQKFELPCRFVWRLFRQILKRETHYYGQDNNVFIFGGYSLLGYVDEEEHDSPHHWAVKH